MDTSSLNSASFSEGRIPQISFQIGIGFCCGLALIAATTRIGLQIQVRRRLQLDDYFLIFACICLLASTIFAYFRVEALYFSEKISSNPEFLLYAIVSHADIVGQINDYTRFYLAITPLLWASIFAVKFAYLIFFRQLVDRVKPLVTYWKIILGITIVSCPICISSTFLSCVKWGLEAVVCIQPRYFRRSLGLAILAIFLDIGIDMMIVSIPVCLLWNARMKRRQKIHIGVFLSLNLFMAITAGVRVSGLDHNGVIDEVWLNIWEIIEASVAICMISLTSFRSLFIASAKSQAAKERAKQPWYSSTLEIVRIGKRQPSEDQEGIFDMPTMPANSSRIMT